MQYLKAQFKIIVLYHNPYESYYNGNIWEPRTSMKWNHSEKTTFFQWVFDMSLTVLRKIKENLSDWVQNKIQDICA